MKTPLALRTAVAGLSLMSLTACGRERVGVGAEGDAINPGTCIGEGIRCGSVRSKTLGSVEPRVCDDEASGTYSSSFVQENPNLRLSSAPDGTAWAVRTEPGAGYSQDFFVEHFDRNGLVIGTFGPLPEAPNPPFELAPAPDGGVVFYLHSAYAPTPDSYVVERGSLYRLDSEAKQIRPRVELANVGPGRVAVGAAGSITLAANSPVEVEGGVRLLRLSPDDEPVFAYPSIPTVHPSGRVGEVLPTDGGGAIVLTLRSFSVDAQTDTFGISIHDGTGSQTEDWLLPTLYQAGYTARMARTPNGTLVVVGNIAGGDGSLLTGYSPEGEPLFAWRMRGDDPPLVDAANGTITEGQYYMYALSEDGTDCRKYDLTTYDAQYGAGTLTFSDGWTFTRMGLPEE